MLTVAQVAVCRLRGVAWGGVVWRGVACAMMQPAAADYTAGRTLNENLRDAITRRKQEDEAVGDSYTTAAQRSAAQHTANELHARTNDNRGTKNEKKKNENGLSEMWLYTSRLPPACEAQVRL